MAYPKKPLQDYERAFEMGRDVEPPAIPTPPNLKPPTIGGGAPRLPVTREPRRTDWEISTPESPVKGEGPYWMRLPLPERPGRHTLFAPVPWERKDVEETYGPAIKQLGDSLWERYQSLPPEQKALPAWQQVAQNPQQAAYTIMSRALANRAKIGSRLTDEAAARVQESPVYRWLNAIGGE